MTGPIDDSTRYLAAASHLDSAYADAAIREFLVEPARQVPPSPGFDAPTVLTEAVAARSRRKFRDGTLAVLALMFLVTAFGSGLFFFWVGAAVLLGVRPIWSKMRSGGPGALLSGVGKLIVLFALVLMIVLLVSGDLLDLLPRSSRSTYYDVSTANPLSSDASELVAQIVAGLMLLILVADRVVVWHLLTTRFGRAARTRMFRPQAVDERPSLSASPPRFRRELERHRLGRTPGADGAVSLIVYRGYNPFVGAGFARKPWSMALPLEKLAAKAKPDGSPFDELTTVALYQRVTAAMEELQASESLSPDRRLRQLKIEHAVYAPADELIDHAHEPVAVPYLPHPEGPPAHFLPSHEAEAVRAQPREWARHYLCFQVETWDRDLLMSAYLHAAVDASTLYLEWTPCVLPPIRDEYRVVDKMVAGYLRPVGQGILRWLKLPVTGLGRAWHTLKIIRPLPHDHTTRNPDRYGSARTLRELGAADGVRDYFQLVDVERYDKIMESRLIPAISRILRDCGYSPSTFEQRATEITTNNVVITGTNNAPIVMGGTNQGTISGGTLQSSAN
ncbi:hypothetical protein [Amycolatopsis sp. NPDC059657]|uniref:hypothetical protein n=1 Tax=Amycolatopsis sp. NPDC059657 TaxID=3346899 RepID=UPI00366D356E